MGSSIFGESIVLPRSATFCHVLPIKKHRWLDKRGTSKKNWFDPHEFGWIWPRSVPHHIPKIVFSSWIITVCWVEHHIYIYIYLCVWLCVYATLTKHKHTQRFMLRKTHFAWLISIILDHAQICCEVRWPSSMLHGAIVTNIYPRVPKMPQMYPLVICNSHWKLPIEIDSLPIKHGDVQ